MPFKFRAAAALDLRRKQEDAARLEVAKAEMAAIEAGQRAREAKDRVGDEGHRLTDVVAGGAEAWRVQWHRAWLEKQRHEADDRAKELAARTAEASKAAQVAREAMKKRRVLERLRDRALHRHQQAEHAQHVKDMNELATLRFVAQIAEEGAHAD